MSQSSKKPLLIIEDDRGIRELLVEFFDLEGYAVFSADNGQSGLEMLHKMGSTLPGLILLDLFMPIMNGNEFLTEVKKGAKLAEIPIAVMTAGHPESEAVKAAAPLAKALLRKPLDLGMMLKVVQQHI